mgnify:CR=1 FL=1
MTTALVMSDHLVVQTDPYPLRKIFPSMREAKVKGRDVCAIPYNLDAARVLNNMGIKTPSPIRDEYDWPGKFTPCWYQIDTAEAMTLNRRFHCHNKMRTGKTLSSLWAADYLRKKGHIQRTLIIAPLSTLWDVWEQHIFEHFPFRSYAVLHGPRAKRFEMLEKECDFYIINHHGINIIENVLKDRPDINHIIVDEVAEFFNTRTKTLWKPLNRVINLQCIDRSAWGLTGTPNPEGRPTDAFGQCKLITPENYKGHFTSFKHQTMLQVSQWKWVAKRDAEKTVAEILRPNICFDRSVCTDMEPVKIDRRCELSEEQKKHYKALINQAATEIRGSNVTAVNAAVLIQKLVQNSCGVVYGAGGEFLRIDFGPRLDVLRELVYQNEEKVVVFVPFTGALNAVASELRKDWSVDIVDGNVTGKKRAEIFRNFRMLKDPHIIVAHPQTMAHGLDLTTASLIIWYAPVHANKIYEQACARIDGRNQKVKIDIAHIYATQEEKRIYEALKSKQKLQDTVVDLLKNIK